MQTPVFVNHSFINTDANEYATGTQCNHKCKEKMKASQRLQPITFKEIRKKLMRDKIRIFAPSYHSSSPSTSLIWETFFFIKSEHHRAQLVDKVLEFQECMQNVNMSDDQVFQQVRYDQQTLHSKITPDCLSSKFV